MNKQKQNNLQSHIQFDTVSPATRLLEKRRRMYQVHQAFQAQKDEEKFKKIQEEIRKRDLQIQIQLVDFCQFLQQNQIKKKKAEERYKQQAKAFEDKLVQIKNLEDSIQDLTALQKLYQSKVQSLKKYEHYLEKVRMTYNDQFPQIADILARYGILKKANNNFIVERKQMEQTHQKLKIEGINYEKQMNQSILQLNNQIKQLSRKLEDRIYKKNQLQMDVQKKHEASSRTNLNLGKILMAIDNLYSKCNQGSQRIKHKYQQFQQTNNDKKNSKKRDEKKPEPKQAQQKKEDEQNNYKARSDIAALKLRCIFNYIKDFKTVIQQFKKEKEKTLQANKK